jgi:2-polyprenyl-3-methyl-5-hydroxy-6-metoxy-1,4-benzoquinol methylase
MTIKLDPEGKETSTLINLLGEVAGKTILEVGCGSGRLTWRYASSGMTVIGIDPDSYSIEEARAQCSAHLRECVHFYPTTILDYLPPSGTRFDRVILSWSL